MLKGKVVGSPGGGGGGTSCSADTKEHLTATVVSIERPRKKLSFREPEIMGYYMQMRRDGAASTGKRTKVVTPVSTPTATVISGSQAHAQSENCLESIGGSFEDLELEVGPFYMHV
jgi:hypothetical protein